MMAGSSSDPDDHERSNPGFFMKSTIKSLSMKFPSVKNITTAMLWSWLQSARGFSLVLLDARPVEEFNVSHIENAIRVDYENTDMDTLVARFENKLKDKPNPTVVCYCSLGYRSSLVAKNLQQFYAQSVKTPVPEVYNLAGSIFQWANEERPMVDAKGNKTHFAHPYTPFWGKLLDAKHRKSTMDGNSS